MSPEKGRKRKTPSFERRILTLALLTGSAGSVVALLLIWFGDYTAKVQWTLLVFIGLWWLGYAFHLRNRIVMPLQTLSNLLAALREGDFSIRARGARRDDALGDVMIEVNTLAETLHSQRLDALEASALLRKIMLEIDVAVFAFDADQSVRLVNRAAERLMAQPAERLLGRSAAELELEECLQDDAPRTLDRSFPGGSGRWETRRSLFRQGGLPLQMLVRIYKNFGVGFCGEGCQRCHENARPQISPPADERSWQDGRARAVHAAGFCLLRLACCFIGGAIFGNQFQSQSFVGASSDAYPISVHDPLMANFLDCIFCHCGPTTVRPPSQIGIYA